MEIFSVMASMSLVDMITAPLRRIAGQMNVTDKAAASLSSGALALSKSLLPIALAAGVLLAALAPCISTAAEFESAMAGVGAVSRATPAEMRELSDAARELGATTAWSAMQVAEGQKYLAMAGFSVQENVAALPAVLNMASAGATELGRAADISSDILSAFNIQTAQMPRVADTLTAAFTTSNTSLELLGETMKYVAPVAEKAGVSLKGTAAMGGLLGNVGIKGSQAGTALRAMLNGLAAPSSEAAKSMAALGVVTTDAVGNLRNPIAILGDMARATESMGSAQKMAFTKAVFGTEAMSAVLALFDQAGAGGIAEYAAQLTSAGTAAEVAARQNETLVGDQKALGSAFKSLQITIGSLFLPAMRAVAQAATWVVRGLDMIADFPGDNRDQRSFITWATLWIAEAYRVAKPGAPLMMFTDWRQLPAMTDALQAGGWLWRNIVVWDKPTARPAKGEFKRQCEFVLIGSKDKLAPATERCLPGVFRHSIVSGSKRQHLTEKPVPLLRDLLQITPEGCTILDPFAGSATTAQACLETGRKFIGVELSEVYFDVACARLNSLANWTI